MGKQTFVQGYTLVELITVLTILSVIAAIVVPSMAGFINKAEEKCYVLEAEGVRRSIEYYLIDHSGEEMDSMVLMLQFTSVSLDSPKNPLAAYLTVKTAKGARLEGMTVDLHACRVPGIIYRAGGYRIEIIDEKVLVDRSD